MGKRAISSRKKKINELDLTGFKLLPTAKPPLFHGSTVRNNVKYLWTKKVRPAVLEQQGKLCAVCGWKPGSEEEIKNLHLHEVEQYDFENKVCHLVEIQVICQKCHAFQHIMRTKSHSTEEQWQELMMHFVKVNDCSPDITDDFDLVIAKSMQGEKEKFFYERPSSLDEMRKLAEKPVRFIINSQIILAEEIIKGIEKKGLLYQP